MTNAQVRIRIEKNMQDSLNAVMREIDRQTQTHKHKHTHTQTLRGKNEISPTKNNKRLLPIEVTLKPRPKKLNKIRRAQDRSSRYSW